MRPHLFLLDHFNNMKVGKKIILAFVTTSIVLILAIQFIGYRMNSSSLKHKIGTLMVDNLIQFSERMDLTMDIYTNLAYQAYVDDKIIEDVNILMEREAGERGVTPHIIYNRLQQAEKSVKGVRYISVICSDGQSVTYGADTSSSIENLWDDYSDLREMASHRNVRGQPGVLATPTTRYKGYDGDEYYFHTSKCMYNYNNLDKGVITTIAMDAGESVLRDIYVVATAEDEAKYNIDSIMDRIDSVISYPSPFYTGINMNLKLSTQEFVNMVGLLKD